MHTLKTAVLAASLVSPALALATTWEIDPSHSSAQFAVKHLMVSTVRGNMGQVMGTVELNDKDVTKSTVNATVDVAGLTTGDAKRDEHLRSPDFFDAAKHPKLTFKSKKVEGKGDKFKVTGDLTMRGVTKEVVLDVQTTGEAKDPWGNIKRAATATTTLNREDFGLKWNKALESGGVLVGKDVTITLDLEFAPKQTKKS